MASHSFKKKHFNKPTCCNHCNTFIWGIGKTGYRCIDCHYSIHTRCFDFAKADCTSGSPAPPSSKSPGASAKHHITTDAAVKSDATVFDDGKLEDFVKVGKVVSKSANGVGVYECVDKKSGVRLTLTSYETAKQPNLSALQRSIQIQRALKHEHILELKYAFKSANHVYVVTEACAGEELFDKIQASGAQSEADCQGIVRQLCRAVEYLHSNNVAHRNLKPENILLISGSNGEQTIKVTGFGSANVVAADVMLQTVAGTPDYVAPEVLRGEPYNESIDIWAIGVVTFILLCGYPPFYAKDLPTLYKQILEAKVTFDEHYWADVSDTAMHFIAKCLVLDSERRYSASECVADPWLDPNMLVAVSPTAATGVAKEHLRAYNAHRKDGKAEPYCPGDDESITNSEPDPLIKPSATQRGDFTQGATTAFYDIGDELGRGGCAIVYRCVEKTNGNVWALKRLIKADIDAVRLSREISIMKQLQHPSILRMKEAFDSHEHIDLIMQLADGGELFDKIIAKGHFSEQEAAVTVCQLLEGLRYMHRKSIAHRDLKPENILVAGEEIKIADFGLSNIQGQQSRLMTPCGTPDYVAPEVLANKGYTLACDVWSAGVIAFIILCGHPPFWDTTRAGLYRKITAGEYDFTYPEWAGVSDVAKDFIRHLMEVDTKKRYTAERALQHPWLADARAAWLEARNERRLLTNLASLTNLAEYNSKLHDASDFKRTPAGEAAFGGKKAVVKKTAEYATGVAADLYTVGEELGRGGCGIVYKCTDKASGRSYALKRILKKDFEMVKLERELAIMQSLEHPRILRLERAFNARESVDLIIELAAGGELFDRIIEHGHFSEQDAAHVIRQLTDGVGYLHSLGIAHRDLKPENVLLVSKDSYDIKIADFGLSNILDDTGAKLATACGTPDYVAPEVLKGEGYNQAVDMWAIGVLTYILLCGYPPFYDKVQAKLFQKIMSVSYKFHENEWKDISVQAKDFISKLLVEQPTLRNSAVQSLRHKWLQVNAPTSSSGSEAANPKNLRSLPTTHHLEVYRKARKVRQADVSDMESAQSESSGTSTPTGSKRHSISHQKAEKGLREKLVGFKMGKTGASKRDKSYQAILLGSKHTPVELSDGYELVYQSEWDQRLIEFIKLERKYHAAKGNKNWIYELAFHMDNLRFRVRGGADTKLYIAQILTQIGKL